MRINSSNGFQSEKVTSTEATKSAPINGNAVKSDNIANTAQQAGTKTGTKNSNDGRASMRNAEMSINARMVATQLQKATETSLSDITSNINDLLKPSANSLQELKKTDPKEPTVAQMFGVDAFQQDFSLDGKNSKSKATAKGAAGQAADKAGSAVGTNAASGSGDAQGTGNAGEGDDAILSFGAVMAMIGGILVRSMEKTMRALEDAAQQLDAAQGGGGAATGGANPAAGGANGTDGNQSGSNGVNNGNAPIDPLLNTLTSMLTQMQDLMKQLKDASKSISDNPAAGNSPEIASLLNKMKEVQAAAEQAGANGAQFLQNAASRAGINADELANKVGGLDNLVANKNAANNVDSLAGGGGDPGGSNVEVAGGGGDPGGSNVELGANTQLGGADVAGAGAQANGGTGAPEAPKGGGGSGPTAALNQKIQELTFNLQQIQQTLNRVNETVTNLSRSETEALKSTIQNLSV